MASAPTRNGAAGVGIREIPPTAPSTEAAPARRFTQNVLLRRSPLPSRNRFAMIFSLVVFAARQARRTLKKSRTGCMSSILSSPYRSECLFSHPAFGGLLLDRYNSILGVFLIPFPHELISLTVLLCLPEIPNSLAGSDLAVLIGAHTNTKSRQGARG